ncbi:MAG: tricarballylate utilization 4Fe-4S protein TcuB [Nitrososphaerota archaeon]|nr:tricarballylate utilization 4Fe-4S protein TcuB [Nitrososphaerota archaeon]
MTENRTEDAYEEPIRQMTVCNACRYCEGICPVWDAMERRRVFHRQDVVYMANLCHDCQDCYTVCPYTPPHPFKINIPKMMSEIRKSTYKDYTSPKKLAVFFENQTRYSLMTIAVSLTLVSVFVLLIGSPSRLVAQHLGTGSFYAIVPSLAIDIVGIVAGLYVIGMWLYGVKRYWNDTAGPLRLVFNPGALWGAATEAFEQTWFKGGGPGCMYPDPKSDKKPSYRRYYLHALVFFGFTLDLIATISATVLQDGLGILPPYPIVSGPVLFGIAGGALIIPGALVLLFVDVRSKPTTFESMASLDRWFLVFLILVTLTGFGTLLLRTTAGMGSLFTLHLGLVLALFLTAPYGKFIHFVYRYVALVVNRIEAQREESSS